jgi:cytochrome c biogenesis protein CcdA
MTPLSILGIGLLLGIRHATDADHVVAVSAILTQQKKLKNASIMFHLVIPPRVGLLLEFTVAIALITLGILNLTGMLQIIVAKLTRGHHHTHLHVHGANPHVHIHDHKNIIEREESGMKVSLNKFVLQFGLFQLLRPVVVGLVHGLAGSAAIALLILSSIKSPQVAVVYLLIFGLGTMIGMMIITTLIGLPIIAASNKFTNINRYITIASGILSLVFGLYLAYEIGVTQQLFGANPQWDPH